VLAVLETIFNFALGHPSPGGSRGGGFGLRRSLNVLRRVVWCSKRLEQACLGGSALMSLSKLVDAAYGLYKDGGSHAKLHVCWLTATTMTTTTTTTTTKLGSAAKRTGKGEGPRLARDIPNGVGGRSGLPVPYG